MGGRNRGTVIADLLDELKRRSGYSYEQIAMRTHLSRSTVHRYCRGQSVPQSFGPVESIALVCGANRAELSKLYRLWERRDRETTDRENAGAAEESDPGSTAGPDQESDATGKSGDNEEASVVAEPVPVSDPAFTDDVRSPPVTAEPEHRATGRETGEVVHVDRANPPTGAEPSTAARRAWFPALAAVAGTLSLLAYLSLPIAPPPPATSRISAPNWTLNPEPLAPEFAGVTLNSSTGVMPGFPVGSVRLWESETRWQNLEPNRGEYDWSTFDRLLDSAGNAALPAVFTFGGTPGWASPNGRTSPYDDDSRTGPPDDLADWERFVRAVAQRSAGRVQSFELWDFGPPYFTGSVETLVEMTEIGSRAIREVAPDATVVCPGFGELWEPSTHVLLERFAQLRGYDHCDAGGVKLHPRKATDPPETMFELGADIERTLHRAGANPAMWNTGVSYENPFEPKVEPELAADHAIRWFLVSLWMWYERVYFYSWGGDRVPIPLQAAGFPPTEAGRFLGEFQRWIGGARISSCGHGRGALLPENVWQCRFDRGGNRFVVRWTHEGTARLPSEPGTDVVQHLDGSSTLLEPGQPMEVTGRPVLLRSG